MTLQERFARASDGDTITLSPSTFNFSPPTEANPNGPAGCALSLQDKSYITVRGLGTRIKLDSHGNGLMICNCDNILIEGITFTGAGPLLTSNSFYYALALLHDSNERITFRNCRFINGGNHGIAHLWGPRSSNNCTVDSCSFENGGNYDRTVLGGDGAAIAIGGAGTVIVNNRIDNWLRGIEVEAHDAPVDCSNIIITGNILRGCAWQSILVTPTGGIFAAPKFRNIAICNNVIEGTRIRSGKFSNTGIYLTGGRDILIANNLISRIADGIGILLTTDHGAIERVCLAANLVEADRVPVLIKAGATGIDPKGILSLS